MEDRGVSNSVDWGMDSVDSMDRGMDSVDSVNRGMDGVDSVDGGVDSVDRGVDSVGNNRGVDSVDWVSSRVGRGRSVVGDSLVGDFSNIATVGISSVVADHLGSAVRESNSVGSSGGVAISLLLLVKLGTTVVISNSVLVSIDSRLIIRRLRSVARSSRHTKGSSQQGGQNDDSLHVDVVCLKV